MMGSPRHTIPMTGIYAECPTCGLWSNRQRDTTPAPRAVETPFCECGKPMIETRKYSCLKLDGDHFCPYCYLGAKYNLDDEIAPDLSDLTNEKGRSVYIRGHDGRRYRLDISAPGNALTLSEETIDGYGDEILDWSVIVPKREVVPETRKYVYACVLDSKGSPH